ncbi:acyl-CoA synthetase [Aeromicrobium alkaliterrae]|uniref:Acyl-CoA synthetase n=1 Tax=Aeromicrobium alkaliterrae TaxID=302168 RepID=A0ABN2JGV7_9ACTN
MTFLAALRDTTRPDDPQAVQIDQDAMSWSELRGAASAFAATLDGAGPVAVNADPSLTTVVAVTGCLLAGVPVVPVAPDSGPAELAHLVRDSGATSWVGGLRDGIDLPVRTVDLRPSAEVPLPAPVDESVVATILYTSGTTGAPKGVLMSQGALRAGIEGLAEAWGWTDADTVAHGLPLFHTHGLVLGVLGSLHLGSRVLHTGKPTPERYAAAGASMYFGVPTIWGRIARDPESARQLSSARLLVSGSAPLPVPVFERLRELTGQSPLERYGMTETLLTLSTRADGERRPGWVGLPVAGAETRIRGEDGEVAPHDGETVGRLEVRGSMLFDGYLGLPEVTAATMTDDGWFVTGDLAVVDAEGFHRIVGRESVDLIKSGGYRIGAGEIETSLLDRPEVLEVAVVGEPDEDLGQRIVAHVVIDPAAVDGASDALAQILVDHVAEDLSWHKRPREIRFVASLPRNHMGKIQKKQLLPTAP